MLFKSSFTSLFICLIFVSFFLCFAQAQGTQISNEQELKQGIEKLVDPRYIIDSTKLIRLVFDFKIDSLGEVHSAHITWSENYLCAGHFSICSKIEMSFNLKFFHERYKDKFGGSKYVYARFPYFSGD
jgi:hypothetical protein